MTLAQIYKLALRQLDEDIEDISEYVELFRQYSNEGCYIVMNDYYKPCMELRMSSDDGGRVYLNAMDVHHVISCVDAYGRTHPCAASPDGMYVNVGVPDIELIMMCQMLPRQMISDQDEPPFPKENHFVLVDYICYRHLITGNAAKQARARVFHDNFLLGCRRIRPQGAGSVRTMCNLYAASSIHARR